MADREQSAERTRRLTVPLNRVEGDLEIRVDLEDGVVAEAWSRATLFRGFESLLVGRDPMDALVLTSRICGLCSVSHLTAAVGALDAMCGAEVPDNAIRLRNVALATEHLQSDLRQAFLLFSADLVNEAHARHPLFEQALRRYRPFQGETVVETISETKRLIEIIAILGGQWPHAAFMVPGGVVSVPGGGDVLRCRQLLARFRGWYESRVLGCGLERWGEVRSRADLEGWLEEAQAHREGEVGFFVRYSRQAGFDRMGRGHGNFLSFGSMDLPAGAAADGGSRDRGTGGGERLVPSGFARGGEILPFDPRRVTEDLSSSWFRDRGEARHPFDGETQPYASGEEGTRYSWAKAPRYGGKPAETGPLAEKIVGRDPLFTDLVSGEGPSLFARELARLVRPATLLPSMEAWLSEMTKGEGDFYRKPPEVERGEGAGLLQAARGALGHWVKVEDRRIRHYQVVTPTAWHASPRDSLGIRGPWEEALVGTPIRDPENPVEIGHVVRSFDPCMVCCVHAYRKGRKVGTVEV